MRPTSALSRCAYPFAIPATIAVAGCTASWNALVRYSDEPAAPTEVGESTVYTTVLRRLVLDWSRDTIVVEEHVDESILHAAVVTQPAHVIRGHWADTLKQQAEVALKDPRLTLPADDTDLRATAARLGLTLIPRHSVLPGSQPAGRSIPRLWLSRAGFNADSTVAAISLEWWCGGRCGHGATLLLARRPGFRWAIWHYHVHWVS